MPRRRSAPARAPGVRGGFSFAASETAQPPLRTPFSLAGTGSTRGEHRRRRLAVDAGSLLPSAPDSSVALRWHRRGRAARAALERDVPVSRQLRPERSSDRASLMRPTVYGYCNAVRAACRRQTARPPGWLPSASSPRCSLRHPPAGRELPRRWLAVVEAAGGASSRAPFRHERGNHDVIMRIARESSVPATHQINGVVAPSGPAAAGPRPDALIPAPSAVRLGVQRRRRRRDDRDGEKTERRNRRRGPGAGRRRLASGDWRGRDPPCQAGTPRRTRIAIVIELSLCAANRRHRCSGPRSGNSARP